MSTAVKKYTDKQLLDRVKSLPGFKQIPAGRWIIGVRSNEDTPNKYDDKFYEYEGEKFIRVLTGTTNPGAKILKGGFRSFNKDGAAILKADEIYYHVWTYGLHRGKMPALRQRGAEVIIYRDGDRDGKSEELGEPHSGFFGINFHTNTYDQSEDSKDETRETIGGWSAGCQVVNERREYFEMMQEYKERKESGEQKWVTYCLLNEF